MYDIAVAGGGLAAFRIDTRSSRMAAFTACLCLLVSFVAPLFYDIKLRQCRSGKGFKEGFHVSYCMRAQWTTIWADTFHNELAYLCMFNPFRIYYLPLDVVSNAKVEVHDSQDKEYIHYVNLKFSLYGKQNKIRVDTGGRGRRLRASANGRELVERTSQFAEILNGSGNRNAK